MTTAPDYPSATIGTFGNAINDTGQIVGNITNPGSQHVGQYSDNMGAHGFLLSGGAYTTLDDPSATNGTFANGINDGGQIVGYYQNAIGTGHHGFLATVVNPPPPDGRHDHE